MDVKRLDVSYVIFISTSMRLCGCPEFAGGVVVGVELGVLGSVLLSVFALLLVDVVVEELVWLVVVVPEEVVVSVVVVVIVVVPAGSVGGEICNSSSDLVGN